MKKILLSILILLAFHLVSAQQPLAVYYFKGRGLLVSTVKDADYVVTINRPDTAVNKDLLIVKAYFPNGKLKYLSGAKSANLRPLYPQSTRYFKVVFQDSYLEFYPNGRKMKICSYEDGDPAVGDEINYYPSGKLYCIKNYGADKKYLYEKCLDTAGNILCENGNGKWIEFFDEVKNGITGNVIDGLPEGKWTGKLNDSVNIEKFYSKGIAKTSYRVDKNGIKTYLSGFNPVPKYQGGLNTFSVYLSSAMRYPPAARENNEEGQVVISFVVAPDGSLNDLRVAQGVSKSLDEEAMRVIQSSPKWTPGMVDGKPVRVAFSVPVNFTLHEDRPSATSDSIFTSVERVPEFIGGLDAFYGFIKKNLKYPQEARIAGIHGRVIVKFILEKDGSLTDIKVQTGIGNGCDEEAIRVISISPKWLPAIQNGHPARVVYSVPIDFKLNENLSPSPSDQIFTSVRYMPEFPGGWEGLSAFLSKNLQYPEEAKAHKKYGEVIVKFIVEKDGTLTDIKVEKGIGRGCDEEAVRVMKLSPKWEPGVQNNKMVRVAYSIPVNFPRDNH